jgi:hypothetical protein
MFNLARLKFSTNKDPFINLLKPEFVTNKEEVLKKYPNVDG